jgi:hypothetical protein
MRAWKEIKDQKVKVFSKILEYHVIEFGFYLVGTGEI